jgi:hypothetical protein
VAFTVSLSSCRFSGWCSGEPLGKDIGIERP